MAVRIHRDGIKKLTAGPIREFFEDLADDMVDAAKRFAPKDTGKLSRSIRKGRTRVTAYTVRVRAGTHTGYGLFVEAGTGIFGPTGRPIRPKKAPFLVFKPKGLNHVIRVRSVKGQPGQHYMEAALTYVVRRL